MNSAAYQRSSKPSPGNERDDRFYSHYLVRRLPAEVILDAYSQVTDVPTPFTQVESAAGDSTTAYAGYPLGTRALQLPDSLVASRFLEAFGRPERVATCSCERQQDSSVGQALHVNNGQTLNDKLRDPKGRVEAWLKEKVSRRRGGAAAVPAGAEPGADGGGGEEVPRAAGGGGGRRQDDAARGAGGPVLGGAGVEGVCV